MTVAKAVPADCGDCRGGGVVADDGAVGMDGSVSNGGRRCNACGGAGVVAPPLRVVMPIDKRQATALVVEHHYLHRRPPISHAFGMFVDGELVGVCTFGTPPSRHAQMSVSPAEPSLAMELNRLWISDGQQHGSASWFVSQCLRRLPPLIVFSYADTAVGHHGGVYRAMSWRYGGQTDEDRKTPRFDYVPRNGKHSRDAFRSGEFDRVRRKPKHRYWTTTGTPAQRRNLAKMCGWADRPYPSAAA